MSRELKFQRCEACAALPSPLPNVLCDGCTHNAAVISAFDQVTQTAGAGRLPLYHQAWRLLNGTKSDIVPMFRTFKPDTAT